MAGGKNEGKSSSPASCLGNPAPLGLLCFGMTTLTLMYVDMGWAEPEFTIQVAAFAFALGGLGQIFVAVFEVLKGSSFSFAVFFCYGAFWLTYAIEFLQKQHLDVNSDGEKIYTHPIGSALYLAQWGILTFCFWIVTLRKNVLLVGVFALLWITFFLLAGAAGTGNAQLKKVGGYFGFATAVGAFYTGVAELINEEYGRHVLPGLKPLYTPERLSLTPKVVSSLIIYDRKTNTCLLQFRGLQIRTTEDVQAIESGVKHVIQTAATSKRNTMKSKSGGDGGNVSESSASNIAKVHIIADYNDTVIADDVADEYWAMTKRLQKKYYLSVTRFAVTSFGTGLRSSVAEGGGLNQHESTAAEQRQLVLNQLQSLQTLSRLVTPAASTISDTADSPIKKTVRTGNNRQSGVGLNVDDDDYEDAGAAAKFGEELVVGLNDQTDHQRQEQQQQQQQHAEQAATKRQDSDIEYTA